VVVRLNFGSRGYADYRIGLPRPGRWQVRFNSDWNGYSSDFGDWNSFDTEAHGPPMHALPTSGSVGIGPYTAVILSQ
jgi:1,4-alpha-glucan branching enzyme